MSPLIVELADHTRTFRLLLRGLTLTFTIAMLIDVMDASWGWAAFNAVVVATSVHLTRDLTRTLERLQ